MNIFKLALLLSFSVLLSGCASVLTSYPKRMQTVRTALAQQDFNKAATVVKSHDEKENIQLTRLELGRIYQIEGNFKGSETEYAAAIKSLRANQLKAKVQFSKLLKDANATVVNPRVIPFEIQSYQAVQLYSYQALNYFALGDLSNALVSIRQGQNEANWIKTTKAAELAEATKKADKEKWKLKDKSYSDALSSTLNAAKGIKSSFENGFFDYLSALFYLANNDTNDAFISLKSALAVAPENKAVQTLLLQTLIQRGGDDTQLNFYLKAFKVKSSPVIPKNSGLIAVIFEQSLIPEIQAVSIPFHTTISNSPVALSLTVPVYKAEVITPPQMSIAIGKLDEKTESIANLYTIAAKALSEDYPVIILRQILMGITKAALATAAGNHGKNLLGALAVDIYNVVTAGADQRSWATLPRYIQVWQAYLPAGQTHITLNYFDHKTTLPVTVTKNQLTLVWVVSLDGKLITKTLPIKGHKNES